MRDVVPVVTVAADEYAAAPHGHVGQLTRSLTRPDPSMDHTRAGVVIERSRNGTKGARS
ncbi:MAG: hypothetical protein M0020_08335 [Actinomycetota bacterium]|jgi:hypothetical protein|nr:hypothetical protein [Actinomycetota bacterium]